MIKKNLNNRPKKVIIPPSTIKSVTNKNKPNNNITKSVDYIKPQKKMINTKYNTISKAPVLKKHRNYTSIGRIEPLFKNQTIFLVGGGASLKEFNFNQLKNKNTIAINKAFLYMPWEVGFYRSHWGR